MNTKIQWVVAGIWAIVMSVSALMAIAGENGMRASYKVGDGLKIGDGNNLVHLQGRVQGRFTYNALEAAADNDTWAVQRGKIKIEGTTLEKKLRFGFQMNLATRTTATTGLATLEDYYVDYIPFDVFGIKVGQFKVPFLMQELTSSGKQQFVDRSLSTGFFNLGRDIGANFHGQIFENGTNYSVFFMNGDGVNTINLNQGLLVGTRLEIPIFGEYKASESDTDDSQEHHLGIGIAYAFNEAAAAAQNGTIAAGIKAHHGTLDVGYKYRGFSFQGAGMLSRTAEGAALTNWGYNAQVGYFIVPKKFEVAVRTAGAVFSNATANQYEHALALNYFIVGHGIKLQTDYALLMNSRGLNLNDHRFRTQLQVIF